MEQLARIELRKARDFGSIINDTFALIRANFSVLGKSFLFIICPMILVLSVISIVFMDKAFSLFELSTKNKMDITQLFTPGNIVWGIIFFILFIVLYSVEYSFIEIMSYETILMYSERGPADFTVQEVWDRTRKDFWKVFFTFFVRGLIVFPAFLLLFIPGMYLLVALSLMPFLRVKEEIGLFRSVSRSVSLISGKWWFTFLVFIVLYFIFISIVGMFTIIPQWIIQGIMMHSPNQIDFKSLKIFFAVIMLLQQLALFVYIIFYYGIALLYYSFVEQKEGTGLLQRIESIGNADAK